MFRYERRDDKLHIKSKLNEGERAAGRGLEVGIGTVAVVITRSGRIRTMIADSRQAEIEDSILTERSTLTVLSY